MPNILLVDDDPALRNALARFISRQGHRIAQASDAAEGIAAMLRDQPDLVITDMEMPGGTGFVVLEAGMKASVPVVILTAHASVEMAVEAMRRGAANFLTKPFSADSVAQVIQEAFLAKNAIRPVPQKSTTPPSVVPVAAREREPGAGAPNTIVGNDEAFTSVLSIVERVADTDASVLLTGESGTGKEIVARAIHYASKRRDKPFVAVNCGAIPEALFESELFGHIKGAFTGATQARRGRFAMAEGGTLFLDEIGEMPVSLQVKLLRVIQEREYEVLGDSRTIPTNVRFVAASNRDLDKQVADGRFREDLYYRLNVVPLHLPPLRERPRDIPLLVEHFVAEANLAYGRHVEGVLPDAMAALCNYGWPGNVRELSNVIERMVLLRVSGKLDLGDIPPTLRAPRPPSSGASFTGAPVHASSPAPISTGKVQQLSIPSSGLDLGETLQLVENVLIEQALARTRGNRTKAAELLRINRTTLVEKLKRREDDDGGDPED